MISFPGVQGVQHTPDMLLMSYIMTKGVFVDTITEFQYESSTTASGPSSDSQPWCYWLAVAQSQRSSADSVLKLASRSHASRDDVPWRQRFTFYPQQGNILPCTPAQLPPTALTPLTPNTVELIPTLGALSPQGGPVQDPVLTVSVPGAEKHFSLGVLCSLLLLLYSRYRS